MYVRPPDRRSTFESTLLAVTPRHIILTHQVYPSRPLVLRGEEVLAAGYHAVWFLFNGAPYDVARFYRPDGAWTGYYVDILEPVRWDGASPDTLEPIVDLFLDLWIAPDGRYEVLDEQEFTDALRSGWISQAQAMAARQTLEALRRDAQSGVFPPSVVRDWMPGKRVFP